MLFYFQSIVFFYENHISNLALKQSKYYVIYENLVRTEWKRYHGDPYYKESQYLWSKPGIEDLREISL